MPLNLSKYLSFQFFAFIIVAPFIILMPIIINSEFSSNSCTIFTVSKEGKAFFANNEDEGLQHGRIWFYPPENDRYGKLLFGYAIQHNGEVYVGGMNDQGLCCDGNMVRETDLNLDPNRIDIKGTFFLEMLEVCATVEDVKNWTQKYNLHLLTWQQVQIADKGGNAIVIGLDAEGNFKITEKTGDYIISTNSFNLAQTRTPCWRYDLVENMLDSMPILTLEYCRDILEATHLPSTMYSYIINLENGIIYLYSHKNFENFATLNAFEEISNGYHSYDILTLVSQQSGILFPAFNRNLLITSLLPSVLLVSIMIFICIVIYIYKIKTILT